MDAPSEAERRVVRAAEVELFGTIESQGVPIRGALEDEQGLAGFEMFPCNLSGLKRSTHVELHGTVPTKQFLDCGVCEFGVTSPPFHFVGVLEEGEETVANEVGRSLETCREQKNRSRDDLRIAEPVLSFAAGDEPTQQVVLGRSTTFSQQVGEVPMRLVHRCVRRSHRIAVSTWVKRYGCSADERLEGLAVFGRDADELADHADGEWEGEHLHHIGLTRVNQGIDMLRYHCVHRSPQRLDPLGRELSADQSAEAGVVGGISEEHVVPGALEELPSQVRVDVKASEADAGHSRLSSQRGASPEPRVPKSGHAVLVARDDDGSERASKQRCGLAQMPVEDVGIGPPFWSEKEPDEDVVCFSVSHRGHAPPPSCREAVLACRANEVRSRVCPPR